MKKINKIVCGICSILMFSNGNTKALTGELLKNIGQYFTLCADVSVLVCLCNGVLEPCDYDEKDKDIEHEDCQKKRNCIKKCIGVLATFSIAHLLSAAERSYKIYVNSKVKSGDKKAESSNFGIAAQGINGAAHLLTVPLAGDDYDDGNKLFFKFAWGYMGYQNLADACLRFFEKRQNSEKSSNQKVNEPRKVETRETQEPEVEAKETQEPEVETKEV